MAFFLRDGVRPELAQAARGLGARQAWRLDGLRFAQIVPFAAESDAGAQPLERTV
jgi:hypothetical protein